MEESIYKLTGLRNSRCGSDSGIQVVIYNLNNGKSDLCLWTMEIAWLVREWIHADEASPKLFNNVASTLGYIGEARGLASSLFSDTEDFYQAAEHYEPKDHFQDQYQERLQILKEDGPLYWQAYFWKVEAECRKRIQQAIEGPKQTLLELEK